MKRRWVLPAGLLLILATLRAHDEHIEPPVSRLMLLHGNVEPLAMAGYRMGEAAMSKVLLKRGSLEAEVVFHGPAAMPLSAVIDGVQSSTGASLGKLNLKFEVTPGNRAWVTVRNKQTGQKATVELLESFVRTYSRLPEARWNVEGVKVMTAPESTIFTVR